MDDAYQTGRRQHDDNAIGSPARYLPRLTSHDRRRAQAQQWATLSVGLRLRSSGISNGDTVVQVGAATGYYTAILAELVGPNGCIIAYETLEDLAERAANSLRCYSQAEVRLGDATQASDLPELDIVVVCAGVTHVPEPWLDNLSDGGRMMLPFTGTKGWGFLMHLRRTGRSFPIRSLGPCGFYDCEGARRDDEAQALTDALVRTPGRLPELNAYHPGSPPKGADNVFYASAAYWISKA
ncbi:MAG: hypothetical protein RIB53_04180 [Roseitalea porphyridii]